MPKSGVTYINPPSAPPVQGMYSHVARMAPGELAFIAGQVAIDAKGNPVGVGDLAAQVSQVFENLGKILKDLGTDFESVVQFTTYLTKADSIPTWMSARSAIFPKLFPGGKYPPNTLLVIDRLVKPEFLLEVEAIARVPASRRAYPRHQPTLTTLMFSRDRALPRLLVGSERRQVRLVGQAQDRHDHPRKVPACAWRSAEHPVWRESTSSKGTISNP